MVPYCAADEKEVEGRISKLLQAMLSYKHPGDSLLVFTFLDYNLLGL